MKFSHPKTLPRAPKPKTASQNEIPPNIPQKPEIKKIKSTSVATLKKPLIVNSKPILVKYRQAPFAQDEEQKIEHDPQKHGLFTTKPSAKYTSIKTIDPFADTSKSKM
jgi:hypothetical protein